MPRLGAVVFAGMAVVASSCGIPTPATPPTAKEVLAKPVGSDLKNAHFTVSGKLNDNGVSLSLAGDGVLVYKPKPAGRFKSQATLGGQTVTLEEITIDGTNYGKPPGATSWVSTKSSTGFDPAAFGGASAQKYLGEVDLPQGKAWHASAKDKEGNDFEAYIRESDGYPIKYVETQGGGENITLTFDRYNAGDSVSAPPPDQVEAG
jgi:hypothetical protein